MQHINPKGISISSKSNNIDSNLSKFHTCNEMHKKKNKPSFSIKLSTSFKLQDMYTTITHIKNLVSYY